MASTNLLQRPLTTLDAPAAALTAVDFEDPVQRRAVMAARGATLCSYLVSLAAYQRGLKVAFLSHMPEQRRLAPRERFTLGRVFTVSNGRATHLFDGTKGDLTGNGACRIVNDKALTKHMLRSKGIRSPLGVACNADSIEDARCFIAEMAGRPIVLKPLGGSMGKGVRIGIDPAEALGIVATARDKLLLEAFVEGDDYRAYVVGDRCVSVFRRVGAHVTGDGSHRIIDLIERKNAARDRNPALFSKLIRLDSAPLLLARQGLALTDVPRFGQRVELSEPRNVSAGGDSVEATDEVPQVLKDVAVAACRACQLPNGGVDIIAPAGATRADEIQVIELNERAHIGSHSFPAIGAWRGNVVGEAIVDHYFPATRAQRPFPGAVFDFGTIVGAMKSRQIGEIGLAPLDAGWIRRRVELKGLALERLRLRRMLELVVEHFSLVAAGEERDVLDVYFAPAAHAELTRLRRTGKPVVTAAIDAMLFG